MLSAVRVSSNCEGAGSVLSASLLSLPGPVVDGNEWSSLAETTGVSVGTGADSAFASSLVLRPDHDNRSRDLCESVRQTLVAGDYTVDDILECLGEEESESVYDDEISVGTGTGSAFASSSVLRPDHENRSRDLCESVRQTLVAGDNTVDDILKCLGEEESESACSTVYDDESLRQRLELLRTEVQDYFKGVMQYMSYKEKKELLAVYRQKNTQLEELVERELSSKAKIKKPSFFQRIFRGKKRKEANGLPEDNFDEVVKTQLILNLLALQAIGCASTTIL